MDYLSAYDTEWNGEVGGPGGWIDYPISAGTGTSGGFDSVLGSLGSLITKAAGSALDLNNRKAILKQNSQYGIPYYEGIAGTQTYPSRVSPLILLLLVGGFILATKKG